MQPEYIIERWELGWVLCAPYGQRGVPMHALSELTSLLPKQDAHSMVMDAGIAHHLRESGISNAVACIIKPKDGDLWRLEINATLVDCTRQERWWRGTEVGCSSAALFAVFAVEPWARKAKDMDMGRGSTPSDADDFGRCERLVDIFPEWRPFLPKVSETYPETKWPAIIDKWDELKALTPEFRTKLLREILA